MFAYFPKRNFKVRESDRKCLNTSPCQNAIKLLVPRRHKPGCLHVVGQRHEVPISNAFSKANSSFQEMPKSTRETQFYTKFMIACLTLEHGAYTYVMCDVSAIYAL